MLPPWRTYRQMAGTARHRVHQYPRGLPRCMTAPPVSGPEECIHRQTRTGQQVHRSGIVAYREGRAVAQRGQFTETENSARINTGFACEAPVQIAFRLATQPDHGQAAGLKRHCQLQKIMLRPTLARPALAGTGMQQYASSASKSLLLQPCINTQADAARAEHWDAKSGSRMPAASSSASIQRQRAAAWAAAGSDGARSLQRRLQRNRPLRLQGMELVDTLRIRRPTPHHAESMPFVSSYTLSTPIEATRQLRAIRTRSRR